MIATVVSKAAISASVDVIILVENRLVREALTKFLPKEDGIRVIASYSLASITKRQIIETNPNVLVLDPTGFLSESVQLILETTRSLPSLKVVLVGMDADDITFLRFVRTGIVGYLLKDASAVEVTMAVRSVFEGKAVCPPQLCLALFEWVAHQELPISNLNGRLQLGLTRREMQILQIISTGCTNKEIAMQLNLSEQTVKNHVHHVLHKIGAANRLKALECLHVRGLGGDAVTAGDQSIQRAAI